jgi:hypothetical protein
MQDGRAMRLVMRNAVKHEARRAKDAHASP